LSYLTYFYSIDTSQWVLFTKMYQLKNDLNSYFHGSNYLPLESRKLKVKTSQRPVYK